jgi:hypothetical protein
MQHDALHHATYHASIFCGAAFKHVLHCRGAIAALLQKTRGRLHFDAAEPGAGGLLA